MSDIVHHQLGGAIRTDTDTPLKGCPYVRTAQARIINESYSASFQQIGKF